MTLNKTSDIFLVNTLKNLKTPIYIANGGNGGDALIYSGTIKFFSIYDIKYLKYENQEKILDEPHDLIIGGGGMYIGDYISNINNPYRKFVLSKNINKCVILPSSFNNCDDFIKQLDSRYIVFCRDEKSFTYITKINNKIQAFLHDDMALQLDYIDFISDFNQNYNAKSNCVKDSLNRLNNLLLNNNSIIIRTGIEENKNITLKSNNVDIATFPGFAYYDSHTDILALAKSYANCINSCYSISTNRLHIAIAATKLNKKVFLYDNSYGKCSSVYNLSMKKYKNITPMFKLV